MKLSKAIYLGKKNFIEVKAFIIEHKKAFLPILFLLVFGDVLFLKTSSDLLTFSVLIAYIILTKVLRLKNRITFLFCLSLLLLMFINFLLSSTSVATEKAAVWLVLFMVIGIVQQWREL